LHVISGDKNGILLEINRLFFSVQEAMFLNYALVGSVATAIHFVAMVFLVELAFIEPALASMVGATAGALIGYVGNRRFTFAESKQSHRAALPRFLLLAVLGALMNGTVVLVGSTVVGVHYLLSQVLATLLTLFVTFTLNRLWTF
jgi:putative flippase GtrA